MLDYEIKDTVDVTTNLNGQWISYKDTPFRVHCRYQSATAGAVECRPVSGRKEIASRAEVEEFIQANVVNGRCKLRVHPDHNRYAVFGYESMRYVRWIPYFMAVLSTVVFAVVAYVFAIGEYVPFWNQSLPPEVLEAQ